MVIRGAGFNAVTAGQAPSRLPPPQCLWWPRIRAIKVRPNHTPRGPRNSEGLLGKRCSFRAGLGRLEALGSGHPASCPDPSLPGPSQGCGPSPCHTGRKSHAATTRESMTEKCPRKPWPLTVPGSLAPAPFLRKKKKKKKKSKLEAELGSKSHWEVEATELCVGLAAPSFLWQEGAHVYGSPGPLRPELAGSCVLALGGGPAAGRGGGGTTARRRQRAPGA